MLITISRQYGAGGAEVARRVAAALGWRLVDNEFVERVARQAGLAPEEVAAREERAPGFIERLAWALASASAEFAAPSEGTIGDLEEPQLVRITENVMAELAREGDAVLVGRGAAAVLARATGALHVKVVAPRAARVARVQARSGLPEGEARRLVETTDAQRARYHREYYAREWADPSLYHLTVNTALLGLEGATATICAALRARRD